MVIIGHSSVKLKGARIVGRSEYDRASWFSKLTFLWLAPIFVAGSKKKLSLEDLFQHCAADDPKECTEHLERNWEKAKKVSHEPNFGWTVFKTYFPYYFALTIPLFLTEAILRVGQALAVGFLTRYFTGTSDLTLQDANYCAYMLIFSTAMYSGTRTFLYEQVMREAYKAKNSVEGLLYKKMLTMSASSNLISPGQILNMMATDLETFMYLAYYMCYLYIAPVQAVICMVVLWYYIQASVITGAVLLVLFIPFQVLMGSYFKKFRRQTTTSTDTRIKLMKEIVSAIRLIKLYCWEKPFSDEISSVRRAEMSGIRKKAYLSSVNEALNFCGTRLILFLTLATHVLAGGVLDAETVFVTMSIFNVLSSSVTYQFSQAVSFWADAKVAAKRVQTFLSLDEQSGGNVNNGLAVGQVVMKNYSAKWDSTSEKLALTDLTHRTEPGKLSLIVGSVGSGKSCLLHALLNDLCVVSGSCEIGGTVSYCPQEAWCFGGTIKENILFGSKYDEKRFKVVVDVCGLKRDLELFPDKDQTIVGEKGYCLSGGQKARVTLARAIYRDADVYLLDDPLSAVDPAVAKHIFQNCIKGFLKIKTVFLVTHQLQFLKKADDIILLENGEIVTKEKYEKRIASGIVDFVSYIRHRSGSFKEAQSYEGETPGDEITVSGDSGEKDDDESSQSSLSTSGVYWAYFRSGASLLGVLSVIFSVIASQFIYNYNDWWLSQWSSNFVSFQTNSTSSPLERQANNLITYTLLTGLLFALAFARTIGTSVLCLKSSINLHNTIFYRLLLTKMAFFETNPMGRILNRFTRDLGFVDHRIPLSLNIVLMVSIVTPIASYMHDKDSEIRD
ncbi:ATP-binding cassette sub-family C member 4 [Halotydeus destructor]|nr:ATP-binding cassette sub-family C member 4 [Halotydeus destructor]